MSECPRCTSEIGTAKYCGCGWHAKSSAQEAQDRVRQLGYTPCEWTADGMQCRYPGTMSSDTHGKGPNFCRHHFGCSDPIFGADVVQASQDYIHQSPEQIDRDETERKNQEARAWLAERGMQKRDDESSAEYIKRLRAGGRPCGGMPSSGASAGDIL